MLRQAVTIRKLLACVGLLSLLGCSSPPNPFPNIPRLSVSTEFRVENLCDIGVSPRISLSGVPDTATTFTVQLSNIDVLLQTPWRETVALTSKTEIPEGAAQTYVGPCIGDNTRFAPLAPFGFRYRLEVLAEDAGGKPVAYGVATVLVQSPYLTARRERIQQQQQQQSTRNAPVPGPPPTQLPATPGGYGMTPYGPAPNVGLMQ